MALNPNTQEPSKFSAGDKVMLQGSEKECGVVVHCWYDSEMCVFDYYVAFFGSAFPEGKPDRIPYVLRYFETSLEKAG